MVQLKSAGMSVTCNVLPTLLNAAIYGVPPKRERVFIGGFWSDLPVRWSFLRETHALDSLFSRPVGKR